MIKKFFYILLALLTFGSSLFSFGGKAIFADDVTPTPTPTDNSSTINSLQQQIADLQNKISGLQGQEKTLSSQIEVMDSQIQLTQLRISATQQQINSLTLDIDTASKKITGIQDSLDNLTKVLLTKVVATYEVGSIQPVQVLLTSGNVGDFLQRLDYLRIAQAHDKKLIYDTVQAKNDYENQKSIYEDKKKQIVALQTQLTEYTSQLDDEKSAKQQLLSETQGSEASYQRQLASLQAQLAALSSFATSRAGVGGSIISHQDLSDGWGKYYNQRDANWGNHMIGYSSEQIWEVGCLMTSYAMVSTHFGASLTPADVAANSDNFSLGTAFFKLPGPSANGHSASYVQNPSIDELRSEVEAGNPVIAGLSADGGPSPAHYSDHWVVLRGWNGSTFQINDPWYGGAMNVSLSDHYSGWTIIEARIYH